MKIPHQKSKREQSSTMCPIPWNHLVIQQNGNYRACCQCIKPPFGILKDQEGQPMNVLTHSFDEARNSPVLQEIRSAMIKGEKPSECNLCWDEEATGLSSRRQTALGIYGHPNLENTLSTGYIDTDKTKLEYMDLRFGNLCNQACRSCGPTDSSLWYKDAHKNNPEFEFYGTKTYKFVKHGTSIGIDSDDFLWYEKPNFEEQFTKNISNIERLYFTGGEPTVNKAHFRTLDLCIEMNRAEHISLEYNSNLMAMPEHLLEKWTKFRSIHLGASIDAHGKLANYVRWPSKWANIEKNIIHLDHNYPSDNLTVGISSTISILNVLNFIDLTKWMITADLKRFRLVPMYHMLHGPRHLNIQNLPDTTKDMIAAEYRNFFKQVRIDYPAAKSLIPYYKNIITFMYDKPSDPEQLKFFFKSMKQLDKSRKQDLFEYIPWLKPVSESLNE